MPVLDINNASLPIPANQNPKAEVKNGLPQFEIQMNTGDTQQICLNGVNSGQKFHSIILQSLNANEITLESTTSDCFITNNTQNNECHCPEERIFNPSAVWKACGTMPSSFERVNISGISGIRLTALANTSVTITFSHQNVNGSCFSSADSCCPLTNTLLSDILTSVSQQNSQKQAYAEQLLHYDATTKECKEFTRHWIYDATTQNWQNFDFDRNLASFTPTGLVHHLPQRFNVGFETINFDNSQVYTLQNIPPAANIAEVAIWNASISYEKDGGMPNPTPTSGFHRASDGHVFELEGRDEITNFKAIGITNGTGTMQIRYKKGLTVNQ